MGTLPPGFHSSNIDSLWGVNPGDSLSLFACLSESIDTLLKYNRINPWAFGPNNLFLKACRLFALISFLFLQNLFEGIVHPKMKMLSSFTHLQIVPNLCEFLSSVEHKRRYFEECQWPNHWLPYFFPHTMKVNGAHQLFGYWHSSKYLLFLCTTEERNSHRFGIFIFGNYRFNFGMESEPVC